MADHRHVGVYAIGLEVSRKRAEEELVEDTTLLHVEVVLHFVVTPAVLLSAPDGERPIDSPTL